MNYNFDRIIDRKNTDSLKYDFAQKKNMPEDILPLWVADMDFQAPKEVIDALIKKSEHGIYGYSESRDDYFNILKKWFLDRFDWEVSPRWLVKTPGVVFAVNNGILAFTNVGDAVLIQEPVYYPFKESILINERRVVINNLIYKDYKYSIDFKAFENQIIDEKVKLFILCSPHNPVGRVWTEEELLKIGDICVKHGVLVIADEIHGDFIYPGKKHIVFANLKPEFSKITITATAPSKTFNLAGLQISNVFIEDQKLKQLFKKQIVKSGYSQLNIMGIVGCAAAYEHGTLWLEELKVYLKENLDLVREFLNEKMPKVKLVEPEGTYLVWLDFSAYGLEDPLIDDLIVKKGKVWLDTGKMFGDVGKGFQRINIACPRAVLNEALERIVLAFQDAE